MSRVAIFVEGGVVSSVLVDDPSITVVLKDYDEADSGGESLSKYPTELNRSVIDKTFRQAGVISKPARRTPVARKKRSSGPSGLGGLR